MAAILSPPLSRPPCKQPSPGSRFSVPAVHRVAFGCHSRALPARLVSVFACSSVRRGRDRALELSPASSLSCSPLQHHPTPCPPLALSHLSWADRNLPSPGTPAVFLAEWILAPLEGWPQKVRKGARWKGPELSLSPTSSALICEYQRLCWGMYGPAAAVELFLHILGLEMGGEAWRSSNPAAHLDGWGKFQGLAAATGLQATYQLGSQKPPTPYVVTQRSIKGPPTSTAYLATAVYC